MVMVMDPLVLPFKSKSDCVGGSLVVERTTISVVAGSVVRSLQVVVVNIVVEPEPQTVGVVGRFFTEIPEIVGTPSGLFREEIVKIGTGSCGGRLEIGEPAPGLARRRSDCCRRELGFVIAVNCTRLD